MSEIEDMITAAGAHAPRVTEEQIKDKIDSELYIRTPGEGLTLCKIQMKNGFSFIGHSACVSPENYRQAIGDKIAYDNAFRQIWSHEGYLLREYMHRMKLHMADLDEAGKGAPPEPDLQESLGQPAHS